MFIWRSQVGARGERSNGLFVLDHVCQQPFNGPQYMAVPFIEERCYVGAGGEGVPIGR